MSKTTLPSLEEFKQQAKDLKKSNTEIKNYSEALEVLAKKYGYRNWNTLQPILESEHNNTVEENAIIVLGNLFIGRAVKYNRKWVLVNEGISLDFSPDLHDEHLWFQIKDNIFLNRKVPKGKEAFAEIEKSTTRSKTKEILEIAFKEEMLIQDIYGKMVDLSNLNIENGELSRGQKIRTKKLLKKALELENSVITLHKTHLIYATIAMGYQLEDNIPRAAMYGLTGDMITDAMVPAEAFIDYGYEPAYVCRDIAVRMGDYRSALTFHNKGEGRDIFEDQWKKYKQELEKAMIVNNTGAGQFDTLFFDAGPFPEKFNIYKGVTCKFNHSQVASPSLY